MHWRLQHRLNGCRRILSLCAVAEGRRRRLLRGKPHHKQRVGPLGRAGRSPAHLRPCSGRRRWACAGRGTLQGLRSSQGDFCKTRDLYLISRKYFEGPPANVFLGFCLQLQKFVENCRKIRKMQNQFFWFPGEEIYVFQKTCIGFLCTFFKLKIQTQFEVFLVWFKIYTCYGFDFWICCSLWHV
jgi:hypothetical protein